MGIGGAGLILGCAGELPATSVGAEAPALDLPACEDGNLEVGELRTPWTWTGDARSLLGRYWVRATEQGGACPALQDDGEYVELRGPCDDGDTTFSGEWTYRRSTGTHRLAGVRLEVDGLAAFVGEGTLSLVRDVGLETLVAEMTIEADTSAELRGFTSTRSTTSAHATGRVVQGGEAWCLDVAADAAPECATEPDGYWALRGAREWVVVYDGSVDCDGCGYLYVDGALDGVVCGMNSPLSVELGG